MQEAGFRAVRGGWRVGAFALNLLDQTDFVPWHLAQHDAVIVTATPLDGMPCIVDVAAPEMPTMADMLAALGAAPMRLEVHFPPDQLDWTGLAISAETPTVLMVRGDPGQLEPFMFPETAAF